MQKWPGAGLAKDSCALAGGHPWARCTLGEQHRPGDGAEHRCACGGTRLMQFLKSSSISQILFSGPHDPLCLVWILPITLFHLSKSESLFSSF